MSSSKVIVVGDPHFELTNIPEVELFVERLEKLCLKLLPDLIVILGDVLHTHEKIHVTPLNKAYDFIHRMRKIAYTFVLIGNHDAESNQIYLDTKHWMNGMKEWENVTIVDKVCSHTLTGKKLFFVPYVYPGRFIEALNTYEDGENDPSEDKPPSGDTKPCSASVASWLSADCIFAHQEFFGCKMGCITSIEGDKWDEGYPYVISGHIHSNQTIQKNVYYPGSAMQHAFGESSKNIIAKLTFSEDKLGYDLEEIDLELPRKKIIYKDVDDIDKFVIPQGDDKLKVSITGDYEEFKAMKKTKKYKEMVEKGIKVIFKPRKIKKGEAEDVEELKELVNPCDIEENKEAFLKILSGLVEKEKNPFLLESYEFIVNDKIVPHTDFLIL
jgi:DNA repair exonuclease SbcCD nuclease subunit